MSTRSNIGYKAESGLLAMIYCHYDGYPRHVGSVLQTYHCSEEHAKALVAGKQIRAFNVDGSYERFDDGGPGVEFYEDIKDAIDGFDYVYIFEDGKWRCFTQELFGIKEIKLP